MKQPYKDFDLPRHHLSNVAHYVPPKARRSSEIERRHELPRGTLLAEHQAQGAAIAYGMLERVYRPEDWNFLAKLLGSSAVDSSIHSIAQHSDTMRRRVKLPMLADIEATGEQPDILTMAYTKFRDVAQRSEAFGEAVAMRLPGTNKARILLGRSMAEAALTLACHDIEEPFYGTPFNIQTRVREKGMNLMADATALAREIGVAPSLAQLPDADSDVSVYIRRTAPNASRQAYIDLLSTHRIEV